MGGWTEILELLAGEDIQRNQMNLCVAVLAGLGRRHLGNLAGSVLDHDEAVLAKS